MKNNVVVKTSLNDIKKFVYFLTPKDYFFSHNSLFCGYKLCIIRGGKYERKY